MPRGAIDWSLHRKGPVDQARHQEKVRAAIRENLADLIADDSLLTTDGRRVVKVPVRSLREYRFRFSTRRNPQVGQGRGGSRKGDVLARQPGDPGGQGDPHAAGHEPGMDYYETEVTLDELEAVLFEELELPNLQPRRQAVLDAQRPRFTEITRAGPLSRADLRRALKENLKRHARQGQARLGPFHREDLRYRSWRDDPRPRTRAVVIAMRDVSGSMGESKKAMSRTFFFWMNRFLESRYRDVQRVFITHHTEAQEVDEERFFHLGESGGTRVSSAYRLALEIVAERYPPADWNLYAVHFSDGDNWGESDNGLCVQLVQELVEQASLFAYGEINESGYRSPLWTAFERVRHPRFVRVKMTRREDIYPALRAIFRPNPADGAAGSETGGEGP
ncbi:sporulation protein YhbH [Thermaerobacter marianensis DSM 12885]|uniref:Sporulation protein YhbH n=1 Tax=Thermaerobacter marianensis (strain ATCC 700841 / DSM 12885 / JCM 10246 / 7p75a) TaxID=644966 RepID=E6SG81_THEM7|nr:sporulation protein YhbH [Thermaerobacter marianensis]ADU50498.1 sporulation protein YhbH [Thermaerobacter marianensis DSM 12885]